jgi:hypothetical protein
MDVSITDFASNRVTNPGQSEIIRQRLYDYQLYPAAGAQQLAFFQAPIGQGVTTAIGGTVGSAKSQWDTSMELGGQLPSGKSFLVESIEVLFLPGASASANTYTTANLSQFNATAALAVTAAIQDVQQFYSTGMLEFNVLSKNYLRETPLLCFPPKAMLDLSAASANTSATTAQISQTLAKAVGRPYYIEPRITLQPAVNFEVLLRWPALVPTISTNNGRVGVILDGYMLRASQ